MGYSSQSHREADATEHSITQWLRKLVDNPNITYFIPFLFIIRLPALPHQKGSSRRQGFLSVFFTAISLAHVKVHDTQ